MRMRDPGIFAHQNAVELLGAFVGQLVTPAVADRFRDVGHLAHALHENDRELAVYLPRPQELPGSVRMQTPFDYARLAPRLLRSRAPA